MSGTKTKKLTLMSLILMIFTSVFGFANMPRAFYLMGYGAIIWYVISALLFFIPYAFMMAEFGATFKNEKGGIYSWMEKSVNPKFAFIGTFMWYASYIVWMVSVSSSLLIPLSNAVFGYDKTAELSLLGLSSTQSLGLIGIVIVLAITYISTKGVDKITKVTSVGGTAVALLNILLLVGGLVVLISNKGEFAQPIQNIVADFTTSPNPSYQTPLTVLSFMTFAIFAFGGLEVLGGLVDQTENAEKTFPKGLAIAALVIAVGYSVGIFACGMFVNWDSILAADTVNMSNVTYIMMQNLGFELGQVFGLSNANAMTLGLWTSRFVGLSMFLALIGAFFTLTYSPLKTLIQGAPKEIWPGKLGEIKDGMPINAMKVQAVIVVVMILFVSFGGPSAAEFFSLLALMTNVAMTLPYMFLSIAFPLFKKKQLEGKIETSFQVYNTYSKAMAASVVVTFIVGFANLFTIIEPAINGNITNTIAMIGGPVTFTVVALLLYNRYEKKYLQESLREVID